MSAYSKQRRHHDGIERRLAPGAAVGAGDGDEVQMVAHQRQHEAGGVVFGIRLGPCSPADLADDSDGLLDRANASVNHHGFGFAVDQC